MRRMGNSTLYVLHAMHAMNVMSLTHITHAKRANACNDEAHTNARKGTEGSNANEALPELESTGEGRCYILY